MPAREGEFLIYNPENLETEHVVLVNLEDVAIGTMEKMEAHRQGILHRAFSIYLFNDKGELLLQKRADTKYHSGGLWTNTCCGHPRPNEATEPAAHRRLKEELGMTAVLTEYNSFIYKAHLDHGLIEHELLHIFIGKTVPFPIPNAEEVSDWRFQETTFLQKDILLRPHLYTEWFKITLPMFLEKAPSVLFPEH